MSTRATNMTVAIECDAFHFADALGGARIVPAVATPGLQRLTSGGRSKCAIPAFS